MSHIVMKVSYIDCVWKKCKNLQVIESIEIYFYVDVDNNFVIEYNFHKEDFNLWEQILEIHKENIEKCSLYNNFDEEIEKLENKYIYYTLKLKSKEPNLYRNISSIIYIEDEKGFNNSEEMLKKNTWAI